jgi:hypothetical protein
MAWSNADTIASMTAGDVACEASPPVNRRIAVTSSAPVDGECGCVATALRLGDGVTVRLDESEREWLGVAVTLRLRVTVAAAVRDQLLERDAERDNDAEGVCDRVLLGVAVPLLLSVGGTVADRVTAAVEVPLRLDDGAPLCDAVRVAAALCEAAATVAEALAAGEHTHDGVPVG